MKVCSKCKEEKELSKFKRRKGAKDGHRGVCKECMSLTEKIRIEGKDDATKELYKERRKRAQKDFYWNHRDRMISKSKAYREENREEINKRERETNRDRREYSREYYELNKDIIKLRVKERSKTEDSTNKRIKYESKMKDLHPNKLKARNTIRHLIKSGKIIRLSICEICGSEEDTHAHHWSYLEEHWGDVTWCCPTCHSRIHHDRLDYEWID